MHFLCIQNTICRTLLRNRKTGSDSSKLHYAWNLQLAIPLGSEKCPLINSSVYVTVGLCCLAACQFMKGVRLKGFDCTSC